MRVAIPLTILALLACAGLFSFAPWSHAVDDDVSPRLVDWSDIPKKVRIIGRLGISLGEDVVTIRGRWRTDSEYDKVEMDPLRKGCFSFVVTSIDGTPTQIPIEIPCDFVEPFRPRGRLEKVANTERTWSAEGWRTGDCVPKAFDGDEWEMVGYEAGHTTGNPRRIAHMFKHEQNPYSAGGFVTEFRFVKVRVFGKPHDEAEAGGYTFGGDEVEEVEDPPEGTPAQGKGNGMF